MWQLCLRDFPGRTAPMGRRGVLAMTRGIVRRCPVCSGRSCRKSLKRSTGLPVCRMFVSGDTAYNKVVPTMHMLRVLVEVLHAHDTSILCWLQCSEMAGSACREHGLGHMPHVRTLDSEREFLAKIEAGYFLETQTAVYYTSHEQLTILRKRVLRMRAEYIPTAVIAAYMHRTAATIQRVGGGFYADSLTTSGESIMACALTQQPSLLWY